MRYNNTNKNRKGFTLTELIIVLAVLAVLAAIAIPKYIELSHKARAATLESLSSSLASASAVNYDSCEAGSDNCVKIDSCTDLVKLIAKPLPNGVTLDTMVLSHGSSGPCMLTDSNVSPKIVKTFNAIGASKAPH